MHGRATRKQRNPKLSRANTLNSDNFPINSEYKMTGQHIFFDESPNATPILAIAEKDLADWYKQAGKPADGWAKAHEFSAKKDELLPIPDADGTIMTVLLGLGQDGAITEPDPWGWAAIRDKLPAGSYRLPEGMGADAQELAALGWGLGSYRFIPYLPDSPQKPAPLLYLSDRTAVERAQRQISAISLVRDLVNTPTNDMLPSHLESRARTLADRFSAQLSVITGEALLEQNFPTIHAVGRASADAPRLIDMRWGRDDAPHLTLVGKGVCFDSGGLDIKPSSGMRIMKKDMGGAAHVLGLAQLIMASGLDVRLRVLIPAVENAISANAFRPGDIITTRKGLTVEISNTDAEGRLVLCDALTLACEEKPDLLLDFATLTGAARVALGPDIPALFTHDHMLADKLARAAMQTGDPLWRLPLWEGYNDYLDSPVASLLNAGETSFAGAITAALYLNRFVEKEISWAHFDVYAWNQKPRPGRPTGGEAMALRACFAMLSERFGSS